MSDRQRSGDRPLRIGVIAPVADAVGPDTSRSIERIVFLLTEELVRRGHDVTLFATADSMTNARLRSIFPRGYDQDAEMDDWSFAETMNSAEAIEAWRDLDIIHSHAYQYALPFTRLTSVPILHTCHVLMANSVAAEFARRDAWVSALSEFQATQLATVPPVGIVYNGIDFESFPEPAERDGYLLYLGVVSHAKGGHRAVDIAFATGRRLVIAGPWGDARADVEPHVDGDRIRYVGAVGVQERNDLLSRADALLYPISSPESFGLVPIEAMACGTPVVASDIGAVGEMVDVGITGFLATDVLAMAQAVEQARQLDRNAVRDRARQRFSYQAMVDGYSAMYARVIAESAQRP